MGKIKIKWERAAVTFCAFSIILAASLLFHWWEVILFPSFKIVGRAYAESGRPGKNFAALVGRERLGYRIYWMGIPVGHAELRTNMEEDGEGNEILHFSSVGKTTGLFSVLHYIDDQIDSYFDPVSLRPISYRVQQWKGDHWNNKRVDFYHSEGKAVYVRNREDPVEFDLVPGAQDPLSLLFYIRRQEIEVGRSLKVQSFIRRKNAAITVSVLNEVAIQTKFGTLKTYHLSPSSGNKSIFKKTGHIDVWLTADKRKVPVRIESKVAIGVMTAVLVKIDTRTARFLRRVKTRESGKPHVVIPL